MSFYRRPYTCHSTDAPTHVILPTPLHGRKKGRSLGTFQRQRCIVHRAACRRLVLRSHQRLNMKCFLLLQTVATTYRPPHRISRRDALRCQQTLLRHNCDPTCKANRAVVSCGRRVEAQLHSFLTSTLDASERVDSRSSLFTSRCPLDGRALGGSREGLDVLKNRTITCGRLCRDSKLAMSDPYLLSLTRC